MLPPTPAGFVEARSVPKPDNDPFFGLDQSTLGVRSSASTPTEPFGMLPSNQASNGSSDAFGLDLLGGMNQQMPRSQQPPRHNPASKPSVDPLDDLFAGLG